MIVDCHTHWGIGFEDRDGGDPTKWLSTLDEHGVDRAFVMGHYSIHRLDRAQQDNDRLAELQRRLPDRVLALGTTWPQQGEASVDEARRCLEDLGLVGLKYHPWVQGFSTADPTFGEICGLAGELEVPIFFHDGTPCYSLSEQIGGLARRFPKTRLVLGHSGLLWNWRSAIETMRHPNVWATLCGPHMRAMEILCERCDPDRLLWGTDYGFSFADPIEYRLGLIRAARIDDGLREKILGVNPLRLLSKKRRPRTTDD